MEIKKVNESPVNNQNKPQDEALKISQEYYNVRNFIRRNYKNFNLKNPLDDSQKGSGKMEIPASLVNGGEGTAILEVKDGQYVVTKSSTDGKYSWQVTYKKDEKYQGIIGNLKSESSITKTFVDTKGDAKTVGLTCNFEATKAEIKEVKKPGSIILKQMQNDLFQVKEKENAPLTNYKYEETDKRITSDIEGIIKFIKENPQVQTMKDPYGGEGTVSIQYEKDGWGNITSFTLAKEGTKHAWKDKYEIIKQNTGSRSGNIYIKKHISSDPAKSRQVTIYQDDPKFGSGVKLIGINDTPGKYLIKDSNAGKWIEGRG